MQHLADGAARKPLMHLGLDVSYIHTGGRWPDPAALAGRRFPDVELYEELVDAKAEHGIALVGPVRPKTSWQAKAGKGYDISAFSIDWDSRAVTCPQGHQSVDWIPGQDRCGIGVVHTGFAKRTCRACPTRALCTWAKTAPREMTFHQPGRPKAIQTARGRQDTLVWQALCGVRAGIEGCLSQGVRVCGLRRSRYVGLAKTHLQHVATAAALNVVRLSAGVQGVARAATRTSRLVGLMAA